MKIITDNTVDYPPRFNKEGVIEIRNHVYHKGREIKDLRNINELIRKGELRTSQATPHDFLKEIKKNEEDIIIITTSSRVSGIHNSALLAKKMSGRKNIEVVDSKSASLGVGLLVERAKQLIKNKKGLQEIAEELRLLADKISIYIIVPTLKYLINNGRINKTIGLLGRLVGIKPLLQATQGEVKATGKLLKNNEIATGLYNAVKKELPRKVYIGVSGLRDEYEKLKKQLRDKEVITISPLSPLVRIHFGPEILAIGWINE